MGQAEAPSTTTGTTTKSGITRRSVLGGVTAAAAATTVLRGTTAEASTAPSRKAKRSNRVETLLRKMTTAEKLGQLQLIGDLATAQKDVAAGMLGGVFSVVGAAQLNALQKIAVEQTRLGIPLIFGLDVIHGYTTNFPIPLGQAAAWDPAVSATDAKVAAGEARPSGIHWTYAPMMDVTHEPRWGRIAEGEGEDPYLASTYAAAKTVAFQGASLTGADDAGRLRQALRGLRRHRGRPRLQHRRRLHPTAAQPLPAAVQGRGRRRRGHGDDQLQHHLGRARARQPLRRPRRAEEPLRLRRLRRQRLHGHPGADRPRPGGRRRGCGPGGTDRRCRHGDGQHQLRRQRPGPVEGAPDHDGPGRRRRTPDPGRQGRPRAVRPPVRRRDRRDDGADGGDASRQPRPSPPRRWCCCATSPACCRSAPPWARSRSSARWPRRTTTSTAPGPASAPARRRRLPTTLLDAITAAAPHATVVYQQGCAVDDTDTSGIAAAVAAAHDADVAILCVGETAAMSGEASARSDIGLPGVQQQLVDQVGRRPVEVGGRPGQRPAADADRRRRGRAGDPGGLGARAGGRERRRRRAVRRRQPRAASCRSRSRARSARSRSTTTTRTPAGRTTPTTSTRRSTWTCPTARSIPSASGSPTRRSRSATCTCRRTGCRDAAATSTCR